MRLNRFAAAPIALLAMATPAHADEVFAGVLAHEVDTPFTLKIAERGTDIQLGWRGDKVEGLKAIGKPAPYVFASVNTAGDTKLVAVGLSWTLGKKVFLRPGIGLALHDGPIPRAVGIRRTDLGSRILFEPEIGLGVRVSKKASLELSWTHISNAQLLSGQNPGIDMIGLRASIKLGK